MCDCQEHVKVWGNSLQVVDAYKTGGGEGNQALGWGGGRREGGRCGPSRAFHLNLISSLASSSATYLSIVVYPSH